MKKALLAITLLISAQSFAAGFDLSKLDVIGRTGTGSNTFEKGGKTMPCEIMYDSLGTLEIAQDGAYYNMGAINGKNIETVQEKGDTLVLRTGKESTNSNDFLCGRGFGTTSQGMYTVAKISANRVEITTSYRCLPNPLRESFTYYCDLK